LALLNVTLIVSVPDPPLDAVPYQISRSPTVASPPLDPRCQVTPPPVTDETAAVAPLGVDVDTANTSASPAVTFDPKVTLVDDAALP
jgi:hypothetical protein